MKKLFKFATYLRLKIAMDPRDRAAQYGPAYMEGVKSVNLSKKTITIELLDENDNEYEIELPLKYEVCPLCEGSGKHVNPSIDAHGISGEEFAEDPDFAESYMQGNFDVDCYQCNGQRVIPEINVDALSAEQKADYEKWEEQQENAARWRADDEKTMRGERGGWDY